MVPVAPTEPTSHWRAKPWRDSNLRLSGRAITVHGGGTAVAVASKYGGRKRRRRAMGALHTQLFRRWQRGRRRWGQRGLKEERCFMMLYRAHGGRRLPPPPPGVRQTSDRQEPLCVCRGCIHTRTRTGRLCLGSRRMRRKCCHKTTKGKT